MLTLRTLKLSLSTAISLTCFVNSSNPKPSMIPNSLAPSPPPPRPFLSLRLLDFLALCLSSSNSSSVCSSPSCVKSPRARSPSFFNPILFFPDPGVEGDPAADESRSKRSSSATPPRTRLRRCFASSDVGIVALNPRMRDTWGSRDPPASPFSNKRESSDEPALDGGIDKVKSAGTFSMIASEVEVSIGCLYGIRTV